MRARAIRLHSVVVARRSPARTRARRDCSTPAARHDSRREAGLLATAARSASVRRSMSTICCLLSGSARTTYGADPCLHVGGVPPDGAMSEYDLVRDVPSHPGGAHRAVEQLCRYLGGGKEPAPVCGRLNALLRAPSVGAEHLQGATRSCHWLKPLLEKRKAPAVKQGPLIVICLRFVDDSLRTTASCLPSPTKVSLQPPSSPHDSRYAHSRLSRVIRHSAGSGP